MREPVAIDVSAAYIETERDGSKSYPSIRLSPSHRKQNIVCRPIYLSRSWRYFVSMLNITFNLLPHQTNLQSFVLRLPPFLSLRSLFHLTQQIQRPVRSC